MKITSIIASSASLPLAAAFVSQQTNTITKTALNAELTTALPPTKAIFDPLGLYSQDSPERVNDLIQPLESSSSSTDQEVWDPLRLYQDQSQVSTNSDMSASLPFLPRPALLDGTLPGDRGFDPFNFSADMSSLQWQRRAEIKHGRIAMLAAAGWPLAELAHKSIASAFDMPVMLASGDRVPSVLNDGLEHASFPLFWIGVISTVAAFEFEESKNEEFMSMINPAEYNPLYLGKSDGQMRYMEEGEIFNGRLAMLAITGFAIQEAFLNSAVVDQIPIFFKPMNVAFEQLMNA